MAKKKGRGGQGGNLNQQIERLKKEVGKEGVAAAEEILEGYEPEIIKLAFKMLPKQQGQRGLGKRIEELLLNVPKSKQSEMRAMLIAAKNK